MKYIKQVYIAILCLVFSSNLAAQSIVPVSSGDGCGELSVKFEIQPADVLDTISSITWNFGDGNSVSGETSPLHLYKKPGLYPVTATINSTSVISYQPGVSVWNLPEARIGFSDTTAIDDYSYVFGCTGHKIDSFVYSYSWVFEGGGSGNTEKLIYTFPGSGIYNIDLVVTDNHGCSDSANYTINVTEVLEVPNVFTPNMDGFNDFFRVKTNGLSRYEFSVYTRSGVLVFKSEAGVIQWDGRSMSGVELSPGLYFYVIKQMDGSANEERSGFVQLIR